MLLPAEATDEATAAASPAARRWCEVKQDKCLISLNSNARTRSWGRRCRRRRRMPGRCLAQRLRHARRGQAREPHADRRLQGARRAGLSRPAEARAAEYARDHLRHDAAITGRASLSRPAATAFRPMIYVPRGNSVEKNRAMRAFGAELVEHGEDFQAAARRSRAPRPVRRPRIWCRRSIPTSCSASRPTRSNCCARRPTSTCSMCRSGRAPASAAASWRAICLG